jgi:predicted transcriptional regulator
VKQNTTQERHFGAQVEALIKAKGLALRDASDVALIPLATLHRRLKDPEMSFTLGELTRLAKALDTTAGSIITDWERRAA